jgi:hypothetical protein
MVDLLGGEFLFNLSSIKHSFNFKIRRGGVDDQRIQMEV